MSEMQFTLLGNTQLRVSRLGLGGCPLGGHGWGSDANREEGLAAVRRAAELGVNFYDTADCYGLGESERLLAEALGAQRHDVVIASKYGVRWDEEGRTRKDISPAHLVKALEASLRRLRVEQIGLYYIHWPDGVTPVEEAVAALDRCREQGKIAAIGVSNFSPDELERSCQVAPVAAVQVQYSLVDRELAEALAETARRNNVSLVTWGSLAQGLLTGKFEARTRFAADDRRSRYPNFQGERFVRNLQVVEALRAVARRAGLTPGQAAVRWLLDTQPVASVLFGAKRPAQVEEITAAAGAGPLKDEDYHLLRQITESPPMEASA